MYRKYTTPAWMSIGLGTVSTIVISILDNTGLLEISSILGSIPLFGGVAIFAVLVSRASPYNLSTEEWLFLRIWETVESLEAYRKAGLEPDRNKTVNELRKAINDVEEWEVGHLTLVKETVGKHVIPLKRNLRDKLLPAIEEGDEENLDIGYNFLGGFAKHLVKEKPTLDDIDSLNDMLKTITTTPSEKVGLKSKLSTSFRTHRRLQHILVFIICGIAGFLSFHIGYSYLNVPMEITYPTGLTVAVGLIAGYLNYLRK